MNTLASKEVSPFQLADSHTLVGTHDDQGLNEFEVKIMQYF
jgi:hypothetical protein